MRVKIFCLSCWDGHDVGVTVRVLLTRPGSLEYSDAIAVFPGKLSGGLNSGAYPLLSGTERYSKAAGHG